MKDHTRENLLELLRAFMDESAARTANRDIEAAERILEGSAVRAPSPETLSAIKSRMVAAAHRRSARIRVFRTAAVAAAVMLMVLIGRHGRGPNDRPGVNFASIIPTAIWESHDIAADDPDLVYFTSQIRQIETQMRDIETDSTEMRDSDVLDDIEVELIAIETEFWKG